jgi:hypothetical protein
MTAQRPTFRQIATPIDVDDGALDRLNEKLGVPALVRSTAERPAGGQGAVQDSPKQETRPSPSRTPQDSSRTKKMPLPTPGPVEKLSIELPGYLTDAMKRQAVENRTSVRHIVMRGLAALGFEIAPGDLVPDARRTRHKARKR